MNYSCVAYLKTLSGAGALKIREHVASSFDNAFCSVFAHVDVAGINFTHPDMKILFQKEEIKELKPSFKQYQFADIQYDI